MAAVATPRKLGRSPHLAWRCGRHLRRRQRHNPRGHQTAAPAASAPLHGMPLLWASAGRAPRCSLQSRPSRPGGPALVPP
eukprot:357124-Chlamydomonas_euryale.AAC.6